MIIDRCVDEAQKMFLSRCKVELGPRTRRSIRLDVLTIDQIVRCCRWSKTFRKPIFLADGQIVEFSNLNVSKIDIIISRSRAVDYQRTIDTITILSRKVRVIPRSPVLCCLEPIYPAFARCDRAFSDTVDTVLGIGVELAKAVPICTVLAGFPGSQRDPHASMFRCNQDCS
jgi:hypothetical protein